LPGASSLIKEKKIPMKKHAIRFLIVAFAFAALSLPALAQGTPADTTGGQGQHHGMPSIDERLQHMTMALNLSDDQQAKVRSILKDQQNQMGPLKQDTSMSQQDRRAKFQQIHEATKQKIRDVLNDGQKAKFDQMQGRHKEGMGKHEGQGDTSSSDKQ
jgi:Spy/CpxP family protein refolding chaperone